MKNTVYSSRLFKLKAPLFIYRSFISLQNYIILFNEARMPELDVSHLGKRCVRKFVDILYLNCDEQPVFTDLRVVKQESTTASAW